MPFKIEPCTDPNCDQDGNHASHGVTFHQKDLALKYDDALKAAAEDVATLCLKRHRAYGLNLVRHGEEGIIIRVDDKTERIWNMLKSGLNDIEPVEDTWLDIAGYALQAVLMRRQQFTLPMRDG